MIQRHLGYLPNEMTFRDFTNIYEKLKKNLPMENGIMQVVL